MNVQGPEAGFSLAPRSLRAGQEHSLKALDLIPRTTNQTSSAVGRGGRRERLPLLSIPPSLQLHAQSTQAVFTPDHGGQ